MQVLLIFLLIIGLGLGLGLYLFLKPKCPDNCEKCDGDKCKVCKDGFGIDINKSPNAKGECKVECPDKCADSVCQYNICTKCQPGYGDGSNKPVSSKCSSYQPVFKLVGTVNVNKCEPLASTHDAKQINTIQTTTKSSCEQTCIQTPTCISYDWNSVDGTCDLWSGHVEADPTKDTSKNYTCYTSQTWP